MFRPTFLSLRARQAQSIWRRWSERNRVAGCRAKTSKAMTGEFPGGNDHKDSSQPYNTAARPNKLRAGDSVSDARVEDTAQIQGPNEAQEDELSIFQELFQDRTRISTSPVRSMVGPAAVSAPVKLSAIPSISQPRSAASSRGRQQREVLDSPVKEPYGQGLASPHNSSSIEDPAYSSAPSGTDTSGSQSLANKGRTVAPDNKFTIFSELISGTRASEPVKDGNKSAITTSPEDPEGSLEALTSDITSELKSLAKETEDPLDKDTDDDRTPSNNRFLTISPLSPSLLESDFFRIGSQGQHVDGWNGLVRSVTRHRHPLTLEPQNRFTLEFDNRLAAKAYRDHAKLLHGRVKERTARGERRSWGNMPAALARSIGDAAMIDAKVFTLASPAQGQLRYRIGTRPADADPRARLGHAAAAAVGAAAVVVRLDGGRASVEELRAFVDQDGRRRGLDWAVTNIRVADGQAADASDGSATSATTVSEATMDGPPDDLWEEGLTSVACKETTSTRASTPGELPDQYQRDMLSAEKTAHQFVRRFIVSFASSAEARRFARNWHRRELHGPGRERRVVDVSVL